MGMPVTFGFRPTEDLEQWLGREYRHAATAMLRSVSACDIVKERPGFGQTVRPVAGSVVASPVLAAYDPDPDYFFHWFRDSAIVIDAVRLLFEAEQLGAEALTHFADFVRFSLSLRSLDGRTLVAGPDWRRKVTPEFEQYLRGDDLLAVRGDAVYADTRVNPDGTLDLSRWSRPQHDGAPLRAATVLRWLRTVRNRRANDVPAELLTDAERLLRIDLALTAARWREPSVDIWEEELGLHYFTLRVSAAALNDGADWLRARGEVAEATALRSEAQAIREALDRFWLDEAGHYASRVMPPGAASTKLLDIAVILAAVHAADGGDAHSARDPRIHATLAKLEQLFDRLYPINRGRPRARAPAMGRYEGDVYYSGGAYYFSTLGASELCFLAAAAHAPGSEAHAHWVAHGDQFLETVRAFTPASGDLSEQFDQRTGAPASAKHLAWSYAAFISCVTARRAVVSP
ncbi:MAG TPA: glycoside hydrolase family 15 protein [Gammaproteobacteria bacterium]|nr:glycoside hydrolase family 15 protein [Gammaproteobacteria bacterium]